MAGNSDLSPFDIGYDQKIRVRAYHLWEADGRPDGGEQAYWEQARALIGMESGTAPGLRPNPVPPGADRPVELEPEDRPEEAFLQQNLGEFPDLFTDQGDRLETPESEAEVKADARLP